ncbi:hypothetical protein DFH27DRAFT_604402 [Peziza echinospora]|nr:hypothetical protein DFH27DRAFT_604402 [Peziza echinospora]
MPRSNSVSGTRYQTRHASKNRNTPVDEEEDDNSLQDIEHMLGGNPAFPGDVHGKGKGRAGEGSSTQQQQKIQAPQHRRNNSAPDHRHQGAFADPFSGYRNDGYSDRGRPAHPRDEWPAGSDYSAHSSRSRSSHASSEDVARNGVYNMRFFTLMKGAVNRRCLSVNTTMTWIQFLALLQKKWRDETITEVQMMFLRKSVTVRESSVEHALDACAAYSWGAFVNGTHPQLLEWIDDEDTWQMMVVNPAKALGRRGEVADIAVSFTPGNRA